ncbi:MAG: flagellar synthesis regulator FleN [Deltaproteobacteria bacterium]|nr:MAG: flagellar synthesis regulator FleN [Deltaproteobacteria bacterium]
MKEKKTSNKVISLTNRISDKKSWVNHKRKPESSETGTRVIAITSGKGGVGKTNIVANLGYSLSALGKKVLIMDADLGLANLDVLLGLAPKYNLSHVITGEKTFSEITVKGPGDISILPASSGIQELTRLTREQGIRFLTELDSLLESYDILLIDTAAGISSNVIYFSTTAQEIIVVVSPEPTSITDGYALMKVLSLKYLQKNFKLLVNLASDREEADDVYRQLDLVSDRFLDIKIEFMGFVLHDKQVGKSVRRQKIVSELFPGADASKCFDALAKRICRTTAPELPGGKTNFFWKFFLRNELD